MRGRSGAPTVRMRHGRDFGLVDAHAGDGAQVLECGVSLATHPREPEMRGAVAVAAETDQPAQRGLECSVPGRGGGWRMAANGKPSTKTIKNSMRVVGALVAAVSLVFLYHGYFLTWSLLFVLSLALLVSSKYTFRHHE